MTHIKHSARAGKLLTATMAVCMLALTACEPVGIDTRPTADAAMFLAEVRSLPAVEHVKFDTAYTKADRYTTVLADDADEAALQTTGDRLTDLYADDPDPGRLPRLHVTSGAFVTTVPQFDGEGAVNHLPLQPVILTDLPRLHALPSVESGSLEGSTADIALDPGTDLRTWVAQTAGFDGSTHLTATVNNTASSSTGAPDSFGFTLGTDTAPEAAKTLFDTADHVGAAVGSGDVGDGTGPPSADFTLPTARQVPALHDSLVAEYGTASLGGFQMATDDGLDIQFAPSGPPITSIVDAWEQLEKAETTAFWVDLEDGTVEAEVDGSPELHALAHTVSTSTWPLAPDTPLAVHHADDPGEKLQFPPQIWDDHADLIGSLWDAGFTSVSNTADDFKNTTGDSPDTELALTISNRTGPDYTGPAGRSTFIRALRSGGWDGLATISLSAGDNVTIISTDVGKAEHAYNARLGTDVNPHGWALEFAEAWDASAG